jgi:hypothetical protein
MASRIDAQGGLRILVVADPIRDRRQGSARIQVE